ncbi:dipeptide ABC transporter ATP-binding protein [Oxalicibacterium flavum]|uniref:dipeptide ABC transporter ATP-binding protein n=1 Tax=Oxalicibacterium flavum TaxID=179467 RepID=UPI001E3D3EC6|nr:ABC transporter ATP-binding protein [Oxalicibacterium flavum]
MSSKASPLVEVVDLRVRFGESGKEVVKGISFSIRRGECLALVGESGSGKSVTARTLVGLTGRRSQVTAERLQFDGADLRSFREADWRSIRGSQIGFVMQDALGSLDPLRTVGEEVAEPLRLHTKLDKRQRAERAIDLLRSVGMPEPETRLHQYPHQLSGGLRQRALIASALACHPDLLLADEPTTALDAAVQAQVLDLLESLQTPQRSMLLVSHDFAVVSRLADRVAVMHHGEIVEQGPLEQILHDPQHPYTKSLLGAVLSIQKRDQGRQRVAQTADGHFALRPSEMTPALARQAPVVVEANNLIKSFVLPNGERRKAVSEVSFALRKGETLGIVGESGSGKTTLMRMILGLEKPDAGDVRLNDRLWAGMTPAEQRAERRRIQVVFQDPLASFDPRYTVARVLAEPLEIAGYRTAAAARARSAELLQMVRLDPQLLDRRPIELSGGQRQRVAIARALAPQPDILICDEPVSALDVSVQAQILDLLVDLKDRLGLSCLFISHDLGVIHRVSDRIMVMKDGVVVESGGVHEVFDNPQHVYTQALLSAVPQLGVRKRVANSIVVGSGQNEEEGERDAA